jgi:DNA polymerase-1
MTSSSPDVERLFLLDGMALAYRAFFSFINRPLMNSRGENTSAIYGFVTTLTKILDDEKPEHVAVVFDTKEPTFRHKRYEAYKATREKMPEDMASQLDKLKDVVSAFNVPLLELAGYEADDIMGTLARKAERSGMMTYLVTGDKDFMQLISPVIRMFKPGKGGDEWEIVAEEGVREKFGVSPEMVVDVLGLTGDASDNIPGVPGIGEKTAIPLVQKFGSIEQILEHVGDIPQKGVREKLGLHRDLALLSKELVTIDVAVPINVDLHQLQAKMPDRERLVRLFTELEFRSLARKFTSLPGPSPVEVAPAQEPSTLESILDRKHTYKVIANEKELTLLCKKLRTTSELVIDTETTGTDPLRAGLLGISISHATGEAFYIPVQEKSAAVSADHRGDLFLDHHRPSGATPTGIALDTVILHLSPILANEKIRKIGQNIKYDMLVLAMHGMEMQGTLFDTMIAHYILRPDARHSLDAIAAELLSYRMISYDDLTGSGKERKELRDIEIGKVAEYSAEDADITLQIASILDRELKNNDLERLCDEIEFPLIEVLACMERAGVALDTKFLSDLSRELERVLVQLTRDIYAHAGEEFNINSTQQLGKVLFDKLGLPPVRKTKTGYSTDVGVLETLRHSHPIIEQMLEYRQMQKLKSTYVDALPALIHPATGRLHTSFNQTVAATGRLSSSDPNLQNIPIRTEIGRSIRKAFIPGKRGSSILSADYSQIELRIMAHVSGDEGLAEAFRNGEDIHATTASKVFGVPLSAVTKDMRRKAKEVNFGIMYGIGPFGLASRLDITQSEAKGIIETYFQRFPRVHGYIKETISKAQQSGYVTTILGRRRYIPDIKSKNANIRGNAERQAINMPIQGAAADMIKLAMVAIHNAIRKSGLKTIMLLQVHDELVFEVPDGERSKATSLVAKHMKEAMPLSVPIEVDTGFGANWLEAH